METKVDTMAKIIERYIKLCAIQGELIQKLNEKVRLLEERCDMYERFFDKVEQSVSKAETVFKEES